MTNVVTKARLLILALALLLISCKLGYGEGLHFFKSILSFIVIISAIVFIHEFGHYIVAKWAGVKIDTFSLGFGNELFGWNDKSGTRWKVSSLPLGGYVKMYGDATEASTPVEDIREFTDEEKGKAFYYKPLYKKAAIVVAGPLFNFLLTISILTCIIITGGLASLEPVVGSVVKGTPAEAAGLQPGDRVLAINGEKVDIFNDIPRLISTNLGTPVKLTLLRHTGEMSVTLTPRMEADKDPLLGNPIIRPIIGIKSEEIKYENVGFLRAVWVATRATYYACEANLKAIGQIITGARSAKDSIAGPIGLAKYSGQAVDKGWFTFFLFIANLSASLGLINLFPIPVLDGGHLLFYGIEAVMGKPPGRRFQEYGMRIGMALVVMLMAYAIINDIHKWLLTLVAK
jgi:regulator of sigma E protease